MLDIHRNGWFGRCSSWCCCRFVAVAALLLLPLSLHFCCFAQFRNQKGPFEVRFCGQGSKPRARLRPGFRSGFQAWGSRFRAWGSRIWAPSLEPQSLGKLGGSRFRAWRSRIGASTFEPQSEEPRKIPNEPKVTNECTPVRGFGTHQLERWLGFGILKPKLRTLGQGLARESSREGGKGAG